MLRTDLLQTARKTVLWGAAVLSLVASLFIFADYWRVISLRDLTADAVGYIVRGGVRASGLSNSDMSYVRRAVDRAISEVRKSERHKQLRDAEIHVNLDPAVGRLQIRVLAFSDNRFFEIFRL